MKLIVGLGNPGLQYQGTRHNVGFEVLAELGRRWQFGSPQRKFNSELCDGFYGGEKVILVAPQTFMNRSGDAVQQVARFYQVSEKDLIVVCDDMNLSVGQLRWRASGSAGGQKGLADIIQRMGIDKIPRLRMGIGRPPGRVDASGWVLGRFDPVDRELIQIAVVNAADSIELLISDGIVAAMNKYNRAAES